MRLASLFKLAEQHASNGVPKGDIIYLRLLGQAGTLINQFEAKYGGFDADTEIPALRDLKQLATPEVKTNPLLYVAGAVAAVLIGALSSGLLFGVATLGYHLIAR